MSVPKKRMSNFTQAEKIALIDIIENKKYILENKKTDGITSKQKEACWQKIAITFNSLSKSGNRDVNSLKNCWDNLKKKTRKHFAEIRRERLAAGGGPMDVIEDPISERVRAIIQPSVEGLMNEFDSDNVSMPRNNTVVMEGNDYDNDDEEVYRIEALDDVDISSWADWNPSILRQEISNELQVKPPEEKPTHIEMNSALPVSQKSQTYTRLSANKRNKSFVDLAESKRQLVELMKVDLRTKSKLEREILEATLTEKQLKIELLRKEIQLKDAELRKIH